MFPCNFIFFPGSPFTLPLLAYVLHNRAPHIALHWFPWLCHNFNTLSIASRPHTTFSDNSITHNSPFCIFVKTIIKTSTVVCGIENKSASAVDVTRVTQYCSGSIGRIEIDHKICCMYEYKRCPNYSLSLIHLRPSHLPIW